MVRYEIETASSLEPRILNSIALEVKEILSLENYFEAKITGHQKTKLVNFAKLIFNVRVICSMMHVFLAS